MGRTTISISDENWQRLNKKKKTGDSFNQVLGRILDKIEEVEENEEEQEN